MMKNFFQSIVAILLALAVASVSATPAYPNKVVRIVVPYPPGGPFDTLLRALAHDLSEKWKQPVIIDNRPGANESIGANVVAKSPADGYTLLASSESGIMMNAFLFSKLSYNPNSDFAPVTRLVQVPMVLVTPADFPATTLKEFIAEVRRRSPNTVNYGSSGVGGATHLPLAMLAKENGLAMAHVPYKGAAPVLQAMLGGEVQLAAVAASVAEQYITSGRLRGLAVSAPARLPSLPQVPTFSETGIKDVQAEFMVGLAAPVGTPNDIVERIALDVKGVMSRVDFRVKYLAPFAFTPIASTPAEFRDWLGRNRPIQAERVKISGAQLN
ncbi:Bug family tripartite tricarboxylate transporter substrate binding protein [Cupriavidus basilensis]|uniref:Bug family tripartite tricarboxylate transporter substrate binding protein n=1 Tax=Cupriavidus basilensis TaxID=68895 RepID=UPI0023E84324|nr:tripartite tricarboxylate transporter substrate binding protein [Cupriavidus basilensis]MDF3887550.1 tripartite tricarboxylate transporter substrate binding protein [Cupriavidus basilensis]